MEQNHELPSSFQETERCFYVCRGGCGRIAFRHRYSPNALFRAYFLFYQCDAKLQTVQWHGGEYDDSRRTRTDCRIPGRRRGEGRTRFPAASPKTALSTTRGGIIAVVARSANGSKRRTRNTDTFCRWSTRKRMETT